MTDQMQKFGHRDSPYSRPTQKWRCGRRDACAAGPGRKGECPHADDPCSPVLSVKSRKRRIIFLIAGIAFFIIVIFLTGKTSLDHLSPGPLSVNHAEVTDCKDCHSAVSETIGDWVSKAVHLNANNDDKKCLSCHELGDEPFNPHSTSRDKLTVDPNRTPVKTSNNLDINLASHLRDWQTQDVDDVSCAVCHREHQGKFAPIDSFNPQQCHVCHSVRFANLKSEHPLYTHYPYDGPTRIKFDHVTHLKKHFTDDDFADRAPDGCKQCHDTDQSGARMLSTSFETSCSNCHLEEILGDGRANAKGVAVLSIPELDIQTLTEAGYYIGQWPAWADGDVTPIMKLLLPEAVRNSPALQDRSIDLYDLSDADPAELRSVAEMAWSIKALFYDIQMGGTGLMNRRIAEALERDFDQPTLNRLVASLPKDTLVNNQEEWFPMLMEELAKLRSGEMEIYQDPARQPGAGEGRDISVERDDAILLDDDIVAVDTTLIDIGVIADDDAILLSDDDDEALLLTEDDDAILLTDDGDEDSLLNDDDEILLDDDAALSDDTARDNPFSAALDFVDNNEDWARSGGWYRDGSTISYRPIDHADPFLKTWLDVSFARTDSIGEMLFSALSDEDAVGNCMKCHSVDTNTAAGSPEVSDHHAGINWQGFKPADVGADFNRFSHVAHFGLMDDEGCSSCHKLSKAAEEDSDVWAASFVDMDRETCTQCHQRGRAPDSCLTCHKYHVEPYNRSIEQISDALWSDEKQQ